MNHLFVAGFDFGTSHSKVVVRDQFSGIAKVVTFGVKRTGLFPSVVRVTEGGLVGPDHSNDEGKELTYPKLFAADAAANQTNFESLYGKAVSDLLRSLSSNDTNTAALFILTRYFLSVLNGIHAFLIADEDWSDFEAERDPLVVQLAVPTGLMAGKDNPVETLMQEALAVATVYRADSIRASSFSTIDDIRSAASKVRGLPPADREALDEHCLTYPEVAAGVQTVFRSRNTPDGKYITLDVGAGTVDINAFLRRSQNVENPRLDYWACEVEPLGFARLDVAAVRKERASHEQSVQPMKEELLLRSLDGAIGHLLKEAFRFQPYTVSGDGPSPWLHGTFAFAWGGGVGHQPYLDQFLTSLKSRQIGVQAINRLPVPDDHFSLPDDLAGNFGRLAVAYGLSYHQANLEAVHLPHKLKPYEELHPVKWSDVYRGDTGVCSCQGNPSCPRCMGSGIIDPRRKIVAKLVPSGPLIPGGDGPSVSSKRQSKYRLALKNLIFDYHRLGKKMVVADRVIRLNQINQLLQRPEVRGDQGLVSDARYILLHNIEGFWGRVRVKPSSAIQVSAGCLVLVNLPQRRTEEMLVAHEVPHIVARIVNARNGRRYFVELTCAIRKNLRGEFFLLAAKPKLKKSQSNNKKPRRRRKM